MLNLHFALDEFNRSPSKKEVYKSVKSNVDNGHVQKKTDDCTSAGSG